MLLDETILFCFQKDYLELTKYQGYNHRKSPRRSAMKYSGLCFLSALMLAGSASAQSQPSSSLSKADRAVIQEWTAHAQTDLQQNKSDRIIFSAEDRDDYCAFIRTYRMKREESSSDITRPAGYTTCVPMQGIEIKRAIAPVGKPPAE